MEGLKKYKDSLINSRVGLFKNQLEQLNRNTYRGIPDLQSNMILDISKYDADKAMWIAQLSFKGKIHPVELNIKPSEAKLLWNGKDELKVYPLKKLTETITDDLELVCCMPEIGFFLKFEETENDVAGKVNKEDESDKVFDKVEIDAEFPGGASAWTRYVSREIERNIDQLQDDGRSGTVVVRFIVDKEGNVSQVRAMNCAESGVTNCLSSTSKLAEVAISAILNGPKWKPAIQNGRQVKAYRRQPVTFQLAEE
jgi:hypothetical protein